MKGLNKGGEHTHPSDLFNINPIAMSNWLSEQSGSIHRAEIEALEHALGLIQAISDTLKRKPYKSIAQLFNTAITLSEFIEYQALGGLHAGDNNEGKSTEQRERKIFLDTIYGGDLNRDDAREYARLRLLEIKNTISSEETAMLQSFKEKIGEDEKTTQNVLQSVSVRRIEAGASLRAEEIMNSALKRIQKK